MILLQGKQNAYESWQPSQAAEKEVYQHVRGTSTFDEYGESLKQHTVAVLFVTLYVLP